MCGRFAQLQALPSLSEKFGARESQQISLLLGDPGPRYNIAPTQLVLAVTVAQDWARELTPLKWGLVPAWAKDTSEQAKCINARAETVAEKASFRQAFRQRRCIIPADAFYEWRKSGAQQPFAIRSADGEPLAFAGLWVVWRKGEQPHYSCTIVTTAANVAMKPIHHRMPVILSSEGVTTWLRPDTPFDTLQELLQPAPSAGLRIYPIGRAVGKVANNSPELLEPITLAAAPATTGTLDLGLVE